VDSAVKRRKRRPIADRFWSKVDRSGECWVWRAYIRPDGYGEFRHPDGYAIKANRFAWEIMNGPIPTGKHVLHYCDNKLCVNPTHLHLGSHADNMREAAERRLMSHGERHHRAKLREPEVAEIRRLCTAGQPQRKVAALFGVSQPNISRIVRGEQCV
jgi:predicted XRE-type DNA-binding protein